MKISLLDSEKRDLKLVLKGIMDTYGEVNLKELQKDMMKRELSESEKTEK